MNGLPAIRKITQEADILWTQDYHIQGSGSGCIKSIISLTSNGYAVTGWESSNGGDVFVMKTNTDGDSLWTQTFDGYGNFDESFCIIENINQELFISGCFTPDNRLIYAVLIKLTNEGNVAFILGEFNSTNEYGFRSMIDKSTNIIGYGRGNLYSYSYEGDSLWISDLTGNSGRGDKCLRLNNNNFILVGSTKINWDYYITLIKTDSLGQYVDIEEYEITPPQFTFNCYPNPFNPIINFEIKSDDIFDLKLRIFNVKGQLVKTIPITGKKVSWDATGFASGIYFCKLQKNNDLLQIKKITLIK
jgi:hypothetical protein